MLSMKMKKRKEVSGKKIIGLSGIVLFILYLILGIVFYFLLNQVTGSGFGFFEIIYAFIFALFVSAFFILIKTLMMKNAYLGAGIGIFGIIVFGYGFTARYAGPY